MLSRARLAQIQLETERFDEATRCSAPACSSQRFCTGFVFYALAHDSCVHFLLSAKQQLFLRAHKELSDQISSRIKVESSCALEYEALSSELRMHWYVLSSPLIFCCFFLLRVFLIAIAFKCFVVCRTCSASTSSDNL